MEKYQKLTLVQLAKKIETITNWRKRSGHEEDFEAFKDYLIYLMHNQLVKLWDGGKPIGRLIKKY